MLELPPTERQKEGDVLDSNRLTAKLYWERSRMARGLETLALKIQATVKEREPVMLFLV